ncbi:isomerase [Streptomyces sp. RerS4]|uniref:5-carboxymethyl-2-hydroxymuconate Delta-isomerase n=1 Tax=Streptomyces sp. RerS4 TaxID=2942449 RepID=UPI00201BD7F2|nr:isomerase [Streptomyces sp. RerS4]UQX04408.1 isomerase [Streptomyces sp. RerS4]
MPQITVDYSTSLAEAFDRRAFAAALHRLTAEAVDTPLDTCKTRFRRIAREETYVADGAPEHAVVHVDVALLPGRTPEVKARLSEAVLELLRAHTASAGLTVHASVDVPDLGAAYRKHVGV